MVDWLTPWEFSNLAVAVGALFLGGRAGAVSGAKERLRVERREAALAAFEASRVRESGRELWTSVAHHRETVRHLGVLVSDQMSKDDWRALDRAAELRGRPGYDGGWAH